MAQERKNYIIIFIPNIDYYTVILIKVVQMKRLQYYNKVFGAECVIQNRTRDFVWLICSFYPVILIKKRNQMICILYKKRRYPHQHGEASKHSISNQREPVAQVSSNSADHGFPICVASVHSFGMHHVKFSTQYRPFIIIFSLYIIRHDYTLTD